jgi:dienelactone hydrolase
VVRLDVAAPGVVMQDVRAPGVVGVFAQRPGTARQRAVLVLGGSEGGLFTARALAPRLASHGFAVLGIATFQRHSEEPLPVPQDQQELPLEVLAAARRWLQAQAGVQANAVAVVGVSKGAELGLVAASVYPWVRALAAFTPSHVVWEGVPAPGAPPGAPRSSWSFEGQALPFVRWSLAAEQRGQQQRQASGSSRLTEAHLESLAEYAQDVPRATIPVERAHAALFLAAGVDDGVWPAAYAVERIAARLKAAGYRHPVQLEVVLTGHQLLGTGWAPTTAFQRGVGRLQGGTAALDAAAQAALWPRLITFLRTHLPP